jgi:hypothetical protein
LSVTSVGDEVGVCVTGTCEGFFVGGELAGAFVMGAVADGLVGEFVTVLGAAVGGEDFGATDPEIGCFEGDTDGAWLLLLAFGV